MERKGSDQKCTFGYVNFKILTEYPRGHIKEAVRYKEVLYEDLNLEVIKT